MGCPGGCIAGAGTITPVKDSQINVMRYVKEAKLKSSDESTYLDILPDIEHEPDESMDE